MATTREVVRRVVRAFELPMGPWPLLMFGGVATWYCAIPGELVVEMRDAAREAAAGSYPGEDGENAK